MKDLTLRDIFKAILDRIVFVAVVPAVFVAVTAFVCWNVLPPTYTATTTLYVLSRSYEDIISYNDLHTSSMLVDDYQALASSNLVMQGAAQMLGLESLDGYKITVSLQNNTRLISVGVEGTDPTMTANVANAIASTLSECILDVMKVENISIIDTAVPPLEPSGPQSLRNTALAGVMGLVLSVGLVLLIETLNTKIRTADDVREFLKLPVLSQIPNFIDR